MTLVNDFGYCMKIQWAELELTLDTDMVLNEGIIPLQSYRPRPLQVLPEHRHRFSFHYFHLA